MALQDILERKEILLKTNDMNNSEKAKEIANKRNILGRYTMDEIEKSCLEMARWKDEQFKKFLREKCFVSEHFISEKFEEINK